MAAAFHELELMYHLINPGEEIDRVEAVSADGNSRFVSIRLLRAPGRKSLDQVLIDILPEVRSPIVRLVGNKTVHAYAVHGSGFAVTMRNNGTLEARLLEHDGIDPITEMTFRRGDSFGYVAGADGLVVRDNFEPCFDELDEEEAPQPIIDILDGQIALSGLAQLASEQLRL